MYCDFKYDDKFEFLTIVDQIIYRESLISDVVLHDVNHKVVQYLFTRTSTGLDFIKSADNKYYIKYIVEEIFGIGRTALKKIIDELIDFNLIDTAEYYDHCFACINCDSERLKFNEVCPNCKSTYIVNSKFIHCFSCGHVGDENSFLNDNQLICPNCHKELHLIGDDYDRTIESSLCKNCNEAFVEADTHAECLYCGHINTDINKLRRNYYFKHTIKNNNNEEFINYIKDNVSYLYDKLNYFRKEFFCIYVRPINQLL